MSCILLCAIIKLSTQRPASPKNRTQHHDVSFQSTLDRRPNYYSQKNGPVESECKFNNVNPHIIKNQYQLQNKIEVTSSEDSTANYVTARQIQNSSIPFKYQAHLPWNTLVSLPKAFQRKNQLKILNKIYQTYLVSTTYTNLGGARGITRPKCVLVNVSGTRA